jgi:predicted transcriptional regulator
MKTLHHVISAYLLHHFYIKFSIYPKGCQGGAMNRIREFREKAGLSQVQLAMLSGVPNSMISDFELGKRHVWPKARRALSEVLSEALKVKISEAELFGNGK